MSQYHQDLVLRPGQVAGHVGPRRLRPGPGRARFRERPVRGLVAPSYAAIGAAAAGHLERHPVDLPPAETAHALAQFQLWVDAAEAGKIGWVYYAARTGGG